MCLERKGVPSAYGDCTSEHAGLTIGSAYRSDMDLLAQPHSSFCLMSNCLSSPSQSPAHGLNEAEAGLLRFTISTSCAAPSGSFGAEQHLSSVGSTAQRARVQLLS